MSGRTSVKIQGRNAEINRPALSRTSPTSSNIKAWVVRPERPSQDDSHRRQQRAWSRANIITEEQVQIINPEQSSDMTGDVPFVVEMKVETGGYATWEERQVKRDRVIAVD